MPVACAACIVQSHDGGSTMFEIKSAPGMDGVGVFALLDIPQGGKEVHWCNQLNQIVGAIVTMVYVSLARNQTPHRACPLPICASVVECLYTFATSASVVTIQKYHTIQKLKRFAQLHKRATQQ